MIVWVHLRPITIKLDVQYRKLGTLTPGITSNSDIAIEVWPESFAQGATSQSNWDWNGAHKEHESCTELSALSGIGAPGLLKGNFSDTTTDANCASAMSARSSTSVWSSWGIGSAGTSSTVSWSRADGLDEGCNKSSKASASVGSAGSNSSIESSSRLLESSVFVC